MIIDLNILNRLGKRFGVMPLSTADQKLQAIIATKEHFIKAPAGIEPAFTGGDYEWEENISGYRFGVNQKLFLLPNGITIWVFKDVLFRGLSLDSVQKWTSGDAEYPMGKANAFFIVYGKLTGQNLGEGETAGNDVPDGETEPGEGGGLATADDENPPPYSKQDIQMMLKGEFPTDTPAVPKASMDTAIPDEPSSPMSGPPPDRSNVGNSPTNGGNESDNIIATFYKQAKINPKDKLSKQNPIRINSDAIIDLYRRAKAMSPVEGEKLIAFLKSGAIKPLEEGMISKHQLNALVEHIVGGIVGEVEKSKQKAKGKGKSLTDFEKGESNKLRKQAQSDKKKTAGMNRYNGKLGSNPVSEPSEPEEPSHSQMDWEPSAETSSNPEKTDYKQWLIQVANKLWKDPMDIWSGSPNSRVSWQITKVIPHETGEYYQLGKTKWVELSRSFVRRNNKWYYLNPDPNDRHWVELGKDHPTDEPSIEQEQSGGGAAGGAPGGMTTTSAVSPVTGPNAFGKKKKWTEKFQGKQENEESLDEMTTTSGGGGSSPGTSGYSTPGAFGRKMSNRKGHIEVLGYKMTPEGEKEYKRPADKLYEAIKTTLKKMIREGIDGPGFPHQSPYIPGGIEPLQQEASGLGADFDRAQTRYDAEMPPEDQPEIECPECGNPGYFTQQWKKGSSYQWSAKCGKCGNTWSDGNLDESKTGKEGTPICRHCKKPLSYAGQIACSHCGKSQGEVKSGEESHAQRFSTKKGND